MDLSLAQAAAIAYDEVFTTRLDHAPTNDELDLVALVLSGYLTIYGSRGDRGEGLPISESELAQGMFWGGARRFESRADPVPISGLAVRRSDLAHALERIKGDVWQEP